MVLTITPDDIKKRIDYQSIGTFKTIEILDALNTVTAHFIQRLEKEYVKVTRDVKLDPDKFDRWMKNQRQGPKSG